MQLSSGSNNKSLHKLTSTTKLSLHGYTLSRLVFNQFALSAPICMQYRVDTTIHIKLSIIKMLSVVYITRSPFVKFLHGNLAM